MIPPPSSTPSFRVSSAPGKNASLFATRLIKLGELIIAEKPILTAHGPEIAGIVESLNAKDQAAFYGLSDSWKPDNPTPVTIFRTNAMPLGAYVRTAGIFPICCRINHSCLPNATYGWNAEMGTEEVHAMTDIPEGVEIVAAYTEYWQSRANRQATMMKNFNFSCVCSVCVGPVHPDSDTRREKIRELDALVISTAARDPAAALRIVKERLRLMDAEAANDITFRSTAHHEAYQACISVSDVEQARRHAGVAYALRCVAEGADNETTQKMKLLFMDPLGHYSARTMGRKMMPLICDGCGKEEAGGKGKAKGSVKISSCRQCNCAVYCSASCKEAQAGRHKMVCDFLRKK